jgi:hypothetical protein
MFLTMKNSSKQNPTDRFHINIGNMPNEKGVFSRNRDACIEYDFISALCENGFNRLQNAKPGQIAYVYETGQGYIGKVVILTEPVLTKDFKLIDGRDMFSVPDLVEWTKYPDEMAASVRWLNVLDKPIYGERTVLRDGSSIQQPRATFCSLNEEGSQALKHALNEAFFLHDSKFI